MGKVVLTQEQVDAIEIFKNNPRDNLYNIAKRKINVDPFQYEYEPFNDMTLDDIAKATYTGYEIEQPKVKVGQWVTNTDCNQTFKVYAVTDKQIVRVEDGPLWDRGIHSRIIFYSHKHTRLATKEEAFWAELGREVNEVREGDCVSTNGEFLRVGRNLGCKKYCNHIAIAYAVELLTLGKVSGFYPAESFKSFPKYWH